ncbi:14102_t:CDS:1, partial [Entrophospora sp. SA101]
RRHHSADRRGRSALRAGPDRSGARQGLQGAGRQPRRRGARSGQAVPAERGLARCVPARHARLERPEPAQAQSADPSHSGPDHHAGRRPAACAGARRLLVRQQADHDRGRQRGIIADQGVCATAPQASADRGGQRRGAAQHHRIAWPRRYRDRDQRHRGRGPVDAARKSLRLRRARPSAARHERFR